MRLLVTRPQPDADRQAEALRALGHDPVVEPLLAVEFLNPADLETDDAQALAVTSRNALRALQKSGELERMRQLPLFAVGNATACLARELGFATVHTGTGTAQQLAPLINEKCEPEKGAIVHLAGEKMAFDLKTALEERGYNVVQPVLYATHPVERLSVDVIKEIAADVLDGVLLMSPVTANTYVRLVDQHDVSEPAKRLSYFCLSENVSDALAGLSGARISVADSPTQDDLLALITREAANC